ncbi:MAG TPA: pyridoxal 5'-phosphate synthase glutaminase subunit PdxT [Acidimicrobiales bacterium]|nr:pyridoxal 5'-phosphate synthase glutaminase subunit PdxT [Acidimicrobiales bacterium]
MPKVGILALQGDVREHTAALVDLGAHVVEVRSPHDLSGVDALVLPGGESTTMSLLLDSACLFHPIAERLHDGMPAFGTCAGMILLATEVLDGRPDQRRFAAIDIAVRRNAFGRQVDSFEADLDVSDFGTPLPAVFIRAPVVERAGPNVDILATIDGRPVLCRQGPVLAAAFHPELSGDLRLHQLFLGGL